MTTVIFVVASAAETLPAWAPSSIISPARKLLIPQSDETYGQFSPDGKWIAYSSTESGRREVYVQGFAPDRVPAAAVGKWQISTAGGDRPRWRRDGRELYYIALDGKLMAVPVAIGNAFKVGVAARCSTRGSWDSGGTT